MSNSQLWVEKYRPTSVDELAMSEENQNTIEKWIEAGEIPHLLLLGPPGCGKTTLADILINELSCEEIRLNASNERGIDVVREKVRNFARASLPMVDWNIIFLDEADQLTPDAQQALRNMMESYHSQTRFILTGNKAYKVEDAIKSRCASLQMAQIPQKRRAQILTKILKAEDHEIDPETVFTYAKEFTDLRRMIMTAQKSILGHGELQPANEIIVSGEDMLDACMDRNWEKVKEVAGDPATDHAEMLKAMFEAVPDGTPYTYELRRRLGTRYHQTGQTPDPVILFKTACAEVVQAAS